MPPISESDYGSTRRVRARRKELTDYELVEPRIKYVKAKRRVLERGEKQIEDLFKTIARRKKNRSEIITVNMPKGVLSDNTTIEVMFSQSNSPKESKYHVFVSNGKNGPLIEYKSSSKKSAAKAAMHFAALTPKMIKQFTIDSGGFLIVTNSFKDQDLPIKTYSLLYAERSNTLLAYDSVDLEPVQSLAELKRDPYTKAMLVVDNTGK